MNDQDIEAFEKWELDVEWSTAFKDQRLAALEAWQAACEYKQREIDEITSILDFKKETNAELQAENKKLREALEVVLGYDGDFLSTSAEVRLNTAKYAAEQALKEIGEE